MKIRFAGFGGQGIVLAGVVFGNAAMLDGKNAMQTQSYGSASRGGLTRSDVCIQTDTIHDLIYDRFDVLIAMSAPSYRGFRGELAEGGHLFYESDLVEVSPGDAETGHGIPATQLAYDTFSRRIIANMIMMGYVNAIVPLASNEALIKTIRASVPPGTEQLNIEAFELGAARAIEEGHGT